VSYHGWGGDGRLKRLDKPTEKPDAAVMLAHDGFRAAALSQAFACVAGAAAVRAGNYRFCSYAELGEPESIKELAVDLRAFIAEFPLSPDRPATCVASFREPGGISAKDFEDRLWATLQGLHDLDDQPWDPTVSNDPQEHTFSFSFAGRAFFVVDAPADVAHAGLQRTRAIRGASPHRALHTDAADNSESRHAFARRSQPFPAGLWNRVRCKAVWWPPGRTGLGLSLPG
jgi:FPC/CPF motif-containing protein YcgG